LSYDNIKKDKRMMQFQGFKPEAQKRIASTLGYNGDMSNFKGYLQQNPEANNKMNMYNQQAVDMMNGGMVGRNYAEGGYAGPAGMFRPTQNFDQKTGERKSQTGNYEYGRTTNGDIFLYGGYVNYGYGHENTGASYSIVAPYGSDQKTYASFQDAMQALNPSYRKDDTPEYRTPKELYTIDKSKLDYDLTTGKISQEEFNSNYYGKMENFEQYTDVGFVYDQSVVNAAVDGTGATGAQQTQIIESTTAPAGTTENVNEQVVGQPQGETIPFGDTTDTNTNQGIEGDSIGVVGVTDTTTDTTTTAVPAVGGTTGPTLTVKDDTVNQQANTSDVTGTNDAIPTAETPVALTDNTALESQSLESDPTTVADITAGRIITPELPTGTAVEAVGTQITDQQVVDNTAGTVSGDITSNVQQASQSGAGVAASTVGTSTVPQGSVSKVVGSGLTNALGKTKEAVGKVDPRATVRAASDTTTAVSTLRADKGRSTDVSAPRDRLLKGGELVTGSANAATASKFTEQVQAKTATPTSKATVEGQLEQLMSDFDGGKTPAWASGAMRAATTSMAQRGLSASSMAGQAIVQAAMEASLPIAMADAKTFAQFESQNLSNKQERAMLSAQQRATFMGQEFDQRFQARVMNATKVSEIANTNFTADQQIALENSRAANTVNLANLSNEQALTLSEAAALSNLEMANLNNSQQAVVLNSQNLMQMDMANLTNKQQANMFKGQQRAAAVFSDASALNAAKQFNATSKNQADQFFANLKTQNSQFNVAQTNAINQYNAGEVNAQTRFTSEMMNQREQFNANNKLVVEQSNAVWRREIATADTAAINRTNELNASALLNVSDTAYNNMWQYYADTMEYAFTSANDERERMTELAIAKLQVDSEFDIAKWTASANSSAAIGQAMIKIATTDFSGDTLLEKGVEWLVDTGGDILDAIS